MKKKMKDGMVITGLGIGAVALYLISKSKSNSSRLPEQIFAPTNLADIPTPRLSYSTVQNIATEVSQSVNESIIKAQALLLSEELAKSQSEQKIKDLQTKLAEIDVVIAELEKTKANYDTSIANVDIVIKVLTKNLTVQQTAYNACLNAYNSNLTAISDKQAEFDKLWNDYLAVYQYPAIVIRNANYISKKNTLSNQMLDIKEEDTLLLRNLSNAEATVLGTQNEINAQIKVKDGIEDEKANWMQISYNPKIAERLAILDSINTYSIAYEVSNTKIVELKKQLGMI